MYFFSRSLFIRVPYEPGYAQTGKHVVLGTGEQRLGVVQIKADMCVQLHARMDGVGQTEIHTDVAMRIVPAVLILEIGVEDIITLDEEPEVVRRLEIDAQRSEHIRCRRPVHPVRTYVIPDGEPL